MKTKRLGKKACAHENFCDEYKKQANMKTKELHRRKPTTKKTNEMRVKNLFL